MINRLRSLFPKKKRLDLDQLRASALTEAERAQAAEAERLDRLTDTVLRKLAERRYKIHSDGRIEVHIARGMSLEDTYPISARLMKHGFSSAQGDMTTSWTMLGWSIFIKP